MLFAVIFEKKRVPYSIFGSTKYSWLDWILVRYWNMIANSAWTDFPIETLCRTAIPNYMTMIDESDSQANNLTKRDSNFSLWEDSTIFFVFIKIFFFFFGRKDNYIFTAQAQIHQSFKRVFLVRSSTSLLTSPLQYSILLSSRRECKHLMSSTKFTISFKHESSH